MSQDPEIVEVVAAVLTRKTGEVMLASRPAGKVYAGYWEFPGGKVEAGETLEHALYRELKEELGIEVVRATRWITNIFTYPHATVRLNFFRVWDWQGAPHPHEGQTFAWDDPAHHSVEPLLPANFPILKALQLPPVYGITHAKALGREAFLHRLDAALEKGLRLIQIRDKDMPEAERLELARLTIQRAKPYQARVLVNGSLELARAAGADGVHLDSSALMNLQARPDIEWLGASCHNAEELAHAAELADFAMLSPVLPTQSHPGEPALGWGVFARLAAQSPIPVYALGGVNWPDVEMARSHGAHGIAMLRGAWT
ncbi:MAG: Nudix family hydrolase [Hydrogenophilaceae bacterium]|nr:Nudix family hydrolase [Hydrogenophilaceae bacterium]